MEQLWLQHISKIPYTCRWWPRITQTTPHNSLGTIVYRCQRPGRNSNGVTPNGGAKQRWGRLQSTTTDQYLTTSQKRCKIDIQLLWNV